MIVRLGQDIAHAIMLPMLSISLNNTLVDIGMMLLKPSGQGRPQVVADRLEVAEFRIRAITLSRYFFIVIGKRGCALFAGNDSCEGVCSLWLVEMSVNDELRTIDPLVWLACSRSSLCHHGIHCRVSSPFLLVFYTAAYIPIISYCVTVVQYYRHTAR